MSVGAGTALSGHYWPCLLLASLGQAAWKPQPSPHLAGGQRSQLGYRKWVPLWALPDPGHALPSTASAEQAEGGTGLLYPAGTAARDPSRAGQPS